MAETEATARAERFGSSSVKDLGAEELALENIRSYTYVRVLGSVDYVFDLTDEDSLVPFVAATNDFTLTRRVISAAREAGVPRPRIIRDTSELLADIMRPNCRIEPTQFDRPSNSQTFGDLVRRAGFEGILYKSTKWDGRCLALFPGNFVHSSSVVALEEPVPAFVTAGRLDKFTCTSM